MESNLRIKPPNEMANWELERFVTSRVKRVIKQLKELKPYLDELRNRFHTLPAGSTIAGYATWNEYCTQELGRTKRAVNYMLAGGNPDNQKRKKSELPEWKPRIKVGSVLAD